MRSVVLDTETTGSSAKNGDRIIEIGAVEMMSFVPTGRVFHAYINPRHPIHRGATMVHGLRNADLENCPEFSEIMPEFLDFVGQDRIMAHNASFDRRFIDAELIRHGHDAIAHGRWTCTVAMVRERLRGISAKLDSVVAHLGIPVPDRKIHGALLDAAILAGVVAHLNGHRDCDIAALASAGLSSPGRGKLVQKTAMPASHPQGKMKPVSDNTGTDTQSDKLARIQDIQNKAADAYRNADDIIDFVKRLEAGGIAVRPHIDLRSGDLRGMRFSIKDYHVTTSNVGFSTRHFSTGPLAFDRDIHRAEMIAAQARHDALIGPPYKSLTREVRPNEIARPMQIAIRREEPIISRPEKQHAELPLFDTSF